MHILGCIVDVTATVIFYRSHCRRHDGSNDCSTASRFIGGFNQRQGEALPPQIFLTVKFVVCIALKIIETVATRCDILRLKGSKFDFGWGSAPDPARGARSTPRPPADPSPTLGPPGLETTYLHKYVSLNPPMLSGL